MVQAKACSQTSLSSTGSSQCCMAIRLGCGLSPLNASAYHSQMTVPASTHVLSSIPMAIKYPYSECTVAASIGEQNKGARHLSSYWTVARQAIGQLQVCALGAPSVPGILKSCTNGTQQLPGTHVSSRRLRGFMSVRPLSRNQHNALAG